jgi:hypothetical protein
MNNSNNPVKNEMNTVETPEQEIARLRAENAQLKSSQSLANGIKLGTNKDTGEFTGTVCLYGLGRFPVALYRSQWEALFKAKDSVEAFITAHRAELDQCEVNRKSKTKIVA